MPKSTIPADIKVTDPAAMAEHDDEVEITDADLGSVVEEEEEEEDAGKTPPKGKTKAKAAKPAEEEPEEKEEEEEPEEEEEEEEPEEEEESEDAAERTKLARKLARAGQARLRLEAQLAELRQKVDTQQQERSDASKAKLDKLMTELDDLYEQVEVFRTEGKPKEASKAQRRIDEIRDGMTRSQAAIMASREALQQTEVRAFNSMVRELEILEPRFDPDHEDFDQELLDDVNELVDGYEGKGLTLTDSLRKACKAILREDVFAKGRSLKKEAPAKKAPPAKKATDVAKNLAAAKKMPPDEPGRTKEKATSLPDMRTISEKDFDALPQATLDRLLAGEEA